MFANLIQFDVFNRAPNSLKGWLRFPIVGLSFALILYQLIYLIFVIPTDPIPYHWRPDHVMTVRGVNQSIATDALLPHPGDVIVSINGKPVMRHLFEARYPRPSEPRIYTLQRDDHTFTFEVPINSQDANQLRSRMTVGIVALLSWLLGAIIVLVAPQQNRDAWQLGLTILAAATVVVTSEGAIQGVPGGWILSNPFLPLVAVAWAQVALMPRRSLRSKPETLIFNMLYGCAILLGLIAALELIYLDSNGTSIEMITGVSFYEVILLWTGIGLLAHLVILAGRAIFMPPSYHRRQVRIILLFVALAYLPSVILTILPRILFDTVLIPWEISMALLVLGPAGYGFVILRQQFLGLDLFITRSLSWLLVSLLVVSGYSLIEYAIQPENQPLLGISILFLLLMAVPKISSIIRRGMDAVIFDSSTQYHDRIAQYTSQLSNDPQISTVGAVVDDLSTLLQIRQTALMMVTPDGQLVSAHQSQIQEPIPPVAMSDLNAWSMLVLPRFCRQGD